MVEHRRLGAARVAQVVVHRHAVQQRRALRGVEAALREATELVPDAALKVRYGTADLPPRAPPE